MEVPSTERIWDEFGDGLRAFIRRRVADDQIADDLLQEVFVRVHNRLETVADAERVGGWVYQIARNAIIDHQRRLARRRINELPITGNGQSQPLVDEEVNINQLVAGWLYRFVLQLPDGYREVMYRFELEGASQADIAQQLGLSRAAVKSRVRRGRQLLKKMLQRCCHFELDRSGNVLDFEPRTSCDVCCDENPYGQQP